MIATIPNKIGKYHFNEDIRDRTSQEHCSTDELELGMVSGLRDLEIYAQTLVQ